MFSAIYYGAPIYWPRRGYPAPIRQRQMNPFVLNWRGRQQTIGGSICQSGYTIHAFPPFQVGVPPYVPPVTISAPPVPPPQQFTTADGTIQGVVDGVNNLFTVGVYLHRAQIFVNGVAQTLNYDCAFGGLAVVFRPGSVPAAGSIISIQGWGNW